MTVDDVKARAETIAGALLAVEMDRAAEDVRALVACALNAEREACAKVADGQTDHWRSTAEHLSEKGFLDPASVYAARAEATATVGALIRARGNP